VGHGGALV